MDSYRQKSSTVLHVCRRNVSRFSVVSAYSIESHVLEYHRRVVGSATFVSSTRCNLQQSSFKRGTRRRSCEETSFVSHAPELPASHPMTSVFSAAGVDAPFGPSLVFIPGAWHQPSCYDTVIALLTNVHQLRCLRVTLPSTQNNPLGYVQGRLKCGTRCGGD